MRTADRNYADMVNPYVRAEQEAEARGYKRGLFHAALFVFSICWLAAVFQ